MIPAFPKIFSLGQIYIKDILLNPIEITEKIDGSAFAFGKLDGQVHMRSKRSMIYKNMADQMFVKAHDYVLSIQDRLSDGKIYYAEYLSKPKHNALKYERIPRNGLALYGVSDYTTRAFVSEYTDLQRYADQIDIDVVPLLYIGHLATVESLKGLLDRKSVYGDVDIEGIVVKNYERSMLIAEQFFPIMCGKFVSEKYKEQAGDWRKDHTNVGRWEGFKQSYRTEARWLKAIQHLREDGRLEGSPTDIGSLFREVHRDITDESKIDIQDFLWDHFGREVLRVSTAGLAEFYKTYLMEGTNDGQ